MAQQLPLYRTAGVRKAASMIPCERETIRERVRLGFNRYEIIATPINENDYSGSWHCPVCNRGDRSAIKYRRPAAALEWARNCIAVHHAATHPEASDSEASDFD